ncbi:MAG: hypothetical protein M1480_20200 [Bacteroidetes bacterium]|nr:hypothetical protein [Bacteroidota bacterium]
MELDYDEFDQTFHKGWRSLSDGNKYKESAESIIYYINNKAGLSTEQLIYLNFHTGQMLAFNNDDESSLKFFYKCFYSDPKNNSEQVWNVYVSATIAFLEKRLNDLIKCRKKLEQLPPIPFRPHLRFVKSFIKNFNDSYKKAYEDSLNPLFDN